MKKIVNSPTIVNSISESHRLLSLPKPKHPLISLIDHRTVEHIETENGNSLVQNLYCISVKKSFKGKMRYGKNFYDFDEGTMSFVAPGQIIAVDEDGKRDSAGWSLLFHPDFIRNYDLGRRIKDYGFFAYDVNEALHLSDDEETIIESIIANISREYHAPIDQHSQDVMVAQIELLLVYSNRFYNRQFITRKTWSGDLLVRLEALLDAYFADAPNHRRGLPTVRYLSERLNVSPDYLSDLLRALTGQNTQQHIHNKLIEKAKDQLAATDLSVGEIAYRLGFEHPQSFNKLFKSKTSVSPLKFRNSFN